MSQVSKHYHNIIQYSLVYHDNGCYSPKVIYLGSGSDNQLKQPAPNTTFVDPLLCATYGLCSFLRPNDDILVGPTSHGVAAIWNALKHNKNSEDLWNTELIHHKLSWNMHENIAEHQKKMQHLLRDGRDIHIVERCNLAHLYSNLSSHVKPACVARWKRQFASPYLELRTRCPTSPRTPPLTHGKPWPNEFNGSD